MSTVTVIQEWTSDDFHRRVVEMEAQGYVAREGTYRIVAEADPETGRIMHLYTIEMSRPE